MKIITKDMNGIEITIVECATMKEFKEEMGSRRARNNCWTKEEEPAYFVNSDETAESMTISYNDGKAYTWRYDDENEEGTCQYITVDGQPVLNHGGFENKKKATFSGIYAAVYESAYDFVVFGRVCQEDLEDRLSFQIDGIEIAFANK